MSTFIEKGQFSRRQFFKGAGLLLLTVAGSGVFAKMGFLASNAQSRYVEKRAAALYTLDESMKIRRSHENPEIIQIYKEFLGEPLSHRSERLLHTRYGKDIPELIEELNKPEAPAAQHANPAA